MLCKMNVFITVEKCDTIGKYCCQKLMAREAKNNFRKS